ncbi:MAG: hypothetical protein HYY24_02015 [Verrucomicrobia bacterium]|nr:hypothetical protein [Verrucomicrobiota bacterium]
MKPDRLRRTLLGLRESTIHVGSRAHCQTASTGSVECVRKHFRADRVGRRSFQREVEARRIFAGKPWIAPILQRGDRWLDFPRYADESRLDRLAPTLDRGTRLRIALQAVAAAFDIFYVGYAHKDFHAKNLFWVEDQLVVIDFEEIEQYPKSARPAFPCSFDLVGAGLPDSDFGGNIMCYVADTPSKMALRHVLGIPLEEALEAFKERLKDDLRTTAERRFVRWNGPSTDTGHTAKIECSFELPFFAVPRTEAQHDSTQRLELLKIDGRMLAGRRLLVLGGSPAGTVFSAQQCKPAFSLGVARTTEEVEAASRIAAYCGLHNVHFIQDGVEQLTADKVGGPFDVVFCSVSDADPKATARDARWLSALTRNILYLEAASMGDPQTVQATLRQCGFRSVSYLGSGIEKGQPKSACQPFFVARKS